MRWLSIGLCALFLLAACSGQPGASPPTAAPAPTAEPSIAARLFEGSLPSGRTAEGYHLLGDPAAPITLVTYSDFL